MQQSPTENSNDYTIINIDNNKINSEEISYWTNPADNTVNATVMFNGKKARLRAGMLVVKNGTEILLGEEADEPGVFSLPGGGLEKGETVVEAAIRECQEEVKINVKNVRLTGHDYCECHEELKDWVIQNVPEEEQWYHYYTCLCIGEYDGQFNGDVDQIDLDPSMMNTAKFYPIKEVLTNSSFKLQWKKALFDAGYIKRRQLTETVDLKPTEIEDDCSFNDIYINNKYVGSIGLSFYDDISALGIGSFEILPELRGNGYGSQVIKYIIDKYSKTYNLIYCYVDATNYGAIKLYKRLGKVFDDEPNEDNQYYVEFYNAENRTLQEDTRTALITKSRSAGQYQDKSRGKNRFERKKYSKVANAVKQYNKIDMNKFFKQDILEVIVPVTGESDNYEVTIKMEGVVAEIAKNIKSNSNKLEYRTVIQALTKVFNSTNVYVKCTCADFKYRFAHWNIVHNVSVDDTAHDPGPGKNVANPNDDKGRGCKHILLVLANGDWMMKVASVINNYIHYAADHLQKPFMKLIFPKLYGVPAEDMIEQDIIDDEKYLESTTGIIDAINEYGRNRGKIKKGSNKNPVADKNNKNEDTEDKK